MSWFQKLYESYDNCVKASESSEYKILPICHSMQTAHVEITIDGEGNFKGAKLLEPSEKTIIPTTEDSASRTSGCEPHGLADKIQYVAKDYKDFGGEKKPYFEEYFKLLDKWQDSQYSNVKVNAVYEYVKKGTVVKDLIGASILYVDSNNNLLSVENMKKENQGKVKLPTINDQGDFFIRWRVNIKDDLQPETWNDEDVRKSWIDFMKSQDADIGMCYVDSDKGKVSLAMKHPKNIYSGSSGAKIVSANDSAGFTYRGRFEKPNEAVGVSFDVSQKAHAVLKYLLSKELRMAYTNDTQTYVAWAQNMRDIPKFYVDSYDLLGDENTDKISGNIGQHFGEKLKKKLYGYSQKLGNCDNISIIGLDSATPGRISVIYYRELKSSDFLERIEKWHKRYSWLQYYSKDKEFYGVASPKDIAKAAYGNQADDKIVKKTVDRILPLIVDNKEIPNDIVESCIRQASKPATLEYWQWRKVLSIACALYKGNHKEEDYQMSLERENPDRNYLYGRLLAVIDYAEQIALYLAKEQRETNARDQMTEFRNKPYYTWEKLHSMFNKGYRRRLKASRAPFLTNIEKELEEIHLKFTTETFKDNSQLSGEYLLAYYCELAYLKHKEDISADADEKI
jgi:CRISPR-associated protein Csd1